MTQQVAFRGNTVRQYQTATRALHPHTASAAGSRTRRSSCAPAQSTRPSSYDASREFHFQQELADFLENIRLHKLQVRAQLVENGLLLQTASAGNSKLEWLAALRHRSQLQALKNTRQYLLQQQTELNAWTHASATAYMCDVYAQRDAVKVPIMEQFNQFHWPPKM